MKRLDTRLEIHHFGVGIASLFEIEVPGRRPPACSSDDFFKDWLSYVQVRERGSQHLAFLFPSGCLVLSMAGPLPPCCLCPCPLPAPAHCFASCIVCAAGVRACCAPPPNSRVADWEWRVWGRVTRWSTATLMLTQWEHRHTRRHHTNPEVRESGRGNRLVCFCEAL